MLGPHARRFRGNAVASGGFGLGLGAPNEQVVDHGRHRNGLACGFEHCFVGHSSVRPGLETERGIRRGDIGNPQRCFLESTYWCTSF